MKNRKAFSTLLVALMISVLCVGSSFAYDASERDDSSRVTVGQNYYGDALLGQIYQTLYNYTTKIKVINTSDSMAVVAKVVFRSALCSAEVLDFNIYLTPTDVWEGEVIVDADGNTAIYSTDDSVIASSSYEWDGTASCNPFTGVWASEETPFEKEFAKPATAALGDINTFGHFEIHGLAAFPATAPLDKDTLAMAYGNIDGVPTVGITDLVDCDFNLDGAATDVPNILTGVFTLENSYYDQIASLNMIALKNWNDDVLYTNSTKATSLSQSVFNSVVETEAVLAKGEYAIPFDFSDATGYADTIIINTLPTHYLRGAGSGIFTSTSCTGLSGVNYDDVYDMSETRLLDYISPVSGVEHLPEVSMQSLYGMIEKAVEVGYDKGWVRVAIPGGGSGTAMDGVSAVIYAGAPIINSYINVCKNGDLDWNYAASPESAVSYAGVSVRQ